MKKLLIIGAGFLQSFVIMKAKQMGYITLAVDADSNAIGFKYADKYKVINIIDEKLCLEYAKSEKIDGVLTAATDYGVLTASYIAQEMNLPGLKYSVAKMIKNKYLVRKRLFDHHVDDMNQIFEVDSYTNISELAKKISYPIMVKPCDGSGSRGTSRVEKEEELENACKYAIENSITHRAELETFIDGQEYGAESLVENGEIHVLAIMKKWMTKPPYYAELGHAIPCGLSKEIEEKAKNYVRYAIKALGINHGSVNMDMIITEDGRIYIVDIGARMGGNMIGPCIIPYGTGIDYMGNMIKVALGEPLDFLAGSKSAVATKLLAFKGGIVNRVPDSNKWFIEKKEIEIFHHLSVGKMVREYHTNLDGCGYIIVRSNTVKKAEDIASEVLEQISEYIF